MKDGTEDIGGLVVPEKVTKEVVQQLEPRLRKSKRNSTLKNFEPEFQLYLIKGTRDEVSDQHSYCFNIEDDPKTFDKEMKSRDVVFWREAINDEMDSIMGNNTWVLADLPPCCKPLGCKWIFKRKLKDVSQLEYSRVIGCLMYAVTCTRPDIAFAVGKLSRVLNSGAIARYSGDIAQGVASTLRNRPRRHLEAWRAIRRHIARYS
ncbi:hypothetical protein Tco_1333659, partial [Tanacetum coccineum]